MSERNADQIATKRTVETVIKVAALGAMVVWCYNILSPFLSIVIWGALIAIIAKPLNDRIEVLAGSRKRAAVVMTLVMLAVFISPTVALVDQGSETTQRLFVELKAGTLDIPEPSDSVKTWPLIGEKTYAFWYDASTNIEATIQKHRVQIDAVLRTAVSKAAGAGATVLMLILAIIIAGVFLSGADGSSQFAKKFIVRLAGERGERLAVQASDTVRNVARGIIGVAILQAALAWIGFYLIDLPAAPLFAGAVLLLSIVQINPLVIMVPTAIYVFSYEASTIIASIYLIWSIAVGLLDNVLKPLVMGKGSDVPIMVIFLGAVGGFIAYGFPGLFVGAVVVVVGYEMCVAWLNDEDAPESKEEKST